MNAMIATAEASFVTVMPRPVCVDNDVAPDLARVAGHRGIVVIAIGAKQELCDEFNS
jgi:hypothetical protein